MTKRKYIVCLVISGLFTLLILLKLCPCYPVGQYIWLDLAAIFGGGVFCSTLVSWFVEDQNTKRNKREQEHQREYILAAAKNSFLRIYERELVEISNYHIKYISPKKIPWSIEHLTPEMLFEKTSEILPMLNICSKEKVRVHYRDVFKEV